MRGNHQFLGRQDYSPPARLDAESLAKQARADVTLRAGMNTWYEVRVAGTLIGYVRSASHGQYYRTLNGDCWVPTLEDHRPDEPRFARPILKLMLAWDAESAPIVGCLAPHVASVINGDRQPG